MFKTRCFYVAYLLIPLVFISCGNEQPIVDNPAAIFSQILPPLSVRAGEVLALQLNARDPDGDELSYEWTAKNSKGEDVTDTVFVTVEAAEPAGETAGETTTQRAPNQGPRVQFSTNEGGTYFITVTIDDGNDNQVKESTVIEVIGVNRSPVLDATDPITISPGPPHTVGQEVFLTAQATDSDGDRITYEWTAKDQSNQAAQEVLEAGTGPTVRFTAGTAGSYLVTVVVNDGNNGQDRASAVVVVIDQSQADSQ